jgi:hypothetical protein
MGKWDKYRDDMMGLALRKYLGDTLSPSETADLQELEDYTRCMFGQRLAEHDDINSEVDILDERPGRFSKNEIFMAQAMFYSGMDGGKGLTIACAQLFEEYFNVA